MIQIIGKGGFAREVQAYSVEPCELSEYKEADDILPFDKCLIAIADPQIRSRVADIYDHLSFTKFLNQDFWTHRSTRIGKGAIVCPLVVVTCNVKIGLHCQLNIGVSVGHDCVIGDFFTAAPKASISGNVTIGDRVYIGSNAVIKEKVTICSDVTIGAGAVVVKDITEPGTYVGIPAKKI